MNSNAALPEIEGTQNLMSALERTQEQAHRKEDNKGSCEGNRLYHVMAFWIRMLKIDICLYVDWYIDK